MLLTTLLLSFAEAAWAAKCDPDMSAMSDSAMSPMSDGESMSSGVHQCPPLHGHDHNGSGGADPECPFALAGGIGCTAPATLPAGVTLAKPIAPVMLVRQPAAAVLAHDFRAHSIFHPPKT